MNIHKEGLHYVFILLFLSAISTAITSINTIFLPLTFLLWIFTVFTAYFFRDPTRTPKTENEKIVISPADGTIIDISEEFESEFIEKDCIRICIFMSIFNVHINRAPVTGKIAYIRYNSGQFLPAYREKASELNEQMISAYNANYNNTKILIKQIAGLIARRIRFWKKMEDNVVLGDKIGMIKFGSRVDVYVPKNAEIKVKLKQKVKGGITELAELC